MTLLPRAFVLALASSLASFAPLVQDAQPREASAGPELVDPRELLREEFFALDLKDGDKTKLVGYAAWRRRREDGGQVLELDIAFPADSTRVTHVERATRKNSRLVWREWRPGSGRTLVIEWNRDQPVLDVVEWGREEGLRTSLPAPDGAVLPLYLLELVRRGDIAEGSFPCIEPLSRSIETLRLSTTFAAHECDDDEAFDLERTVELTAPDGVVTASYTFRGDELVSWTLQHGGLSARRIPADEYIPAIAALECAPLVSEATVRDR